MPLQLIYLSIFIFMLLPSLFSAGPVSKPGCSETCGNLSIPYPFGVGPKCSLDPFFTIDCNHSTKPPKPYLLFTHTEVVQINETFIRVKYPNLVSVCYDSLVGHGMNNATPVVAYYQNMTMDLTGSPFTLSSENSLIVIGCDDMALQSNGSWTGGGCSATCEDKNDAVGYCPFNDTSVGNGCCQSSILGESGYSKQISLLGARLFDFSGGLARRRLFPCSYAFIDVDNSETMLRYPLYYLHNSTALQKDNWASASRPPVVELTWWINGTGDCGANLNLSSYACSADKSSCVDVDDYDEVKGYRCRCVDGYEGNPYLRGGCKANSSTTTIARSDCLHRCGELSIMYPFGIGPKCFLEPSFEITCNTFSETSKAYLTIFNAEIFMLNSSKISIQYPNLGITCYNLSDYQHGAKTKENRLIIDLSKTQYTLSDKNLLSTVGCDDMVTGFTRQSNRRILNTSCASVCWSAEDVDARCQAKGNGCCQASIPRGTEYLEANLSRLSAKWRSRLYSCSFAFVNWDEPYNTPMSSLNLLSNITKIRENNLRQGVLLDWKIGQKTCKEAKRNTMNYVCQNNSECVDFDTKGGGYLCNCLKGYQGNAYLYPGCQDIDECNDNPCTSNAKCINTKGSFSCSCPIWYHGDGRKDGNGCISNVIFFIGMGSGLGFILVLLMFFWLYKMFQKRKRKIVKKRFFKRNGGMLLKQQANEVTIGKPTVFGADELEVATDNFNRSRILGQGGQGTVFKGMLSNGKIVAVKKSKFVEGNQLEQFINEVVVLSQINHRNVVKLLGCCLETEVPLLVYEFMPNGTLFDLIHDPNIEFPFSWKMRLKIAIDIAGALAYLHSASSMPIYHRDIKSSNILLDDKYVVKVSDFGTSKTVGVDQTHLTTLVRGTFGYLDPEYFQSSQFTEKSDVYSFGVVLVELLTRQRPISLDKIDEDRGLAARFRTSMEENCLDMILDPQVLEQDKGEVILVAKLAQRCLNLKGKMRPTMKEVATKLESLKSSQMEVVSKDEYEELIHFEHVQTRSLGTEYTWTSSLASATPSASSDAHPLMFTT